MLVVRSALAHVATNWTTTDGGWFLCTLRAECFRTRCNQGPADRHASMHSLAPPQANEAPLEPKFLCALSCGVRLRSPTGMPTWRRCCFYALFRAECFRTGRVPRRTQGETVIVSMHSFVRTAFAHRILDSNARKAVSMHSFVRSAFAPALEGANDSNRARRFYALFRAECFRTRQLACWWHLRMVSMHSFVWSAFAPSSSSANRPLSRFLCTLSRGVLSHRWL